MKPNELEVIINSAFDNKKDVSENSDKKILDAINETIELTDKGNIRVAEKKNGKWLVNQWVKKAILLSFRVNKMQMSKGPYTTWYDKVQGKSVLWNEEDWKKAGYRQIDANATFVAGVGMGIGTERSRSGIGGNVHGIISPLATNGFG